MDQCDGLITKLITVLLDWHSGDINSVTPIKKSRIIFRQFIYKNKLWVHVTRCSSVSKPSFNDASVNIFSCSTATGYID